MLYVYNRPMSFEALHAYKLSAHNYRRQYEIPKRNFGSNLFSVHHVKPRFLYNYISKCQIFSCEIIHIYR